jgi:hypothetical protein
LDAAGLLMGEYGQTEFSGEMGPGIVLLFSIIGLLLGWEYIFIGVLDLGILG